MGSNQRKPTENNLRIVRMLALPILVLQFFGAGYVSLADQYQVLRPEYDNTMNHNSATSIVFVPYYHLAKPVDDRQYVEFHTLKSSLNFLLFELPLVSLGQTVVHELGHGFRGRDVGVSTDYAFGLPMPYSRLVSKQKRLGEAIAETKRNLLPDEVNLIEIGGLEANKIQANYLAKLSMESSIYDRPTANQYFVSKLSTPLYGFLARNKKDIEGIRGIKNTRSKAFINILDPLIFSSVAKNASYIKTGTYNKSFPWLVESSGFNWLPYFSYNIVPFGESYGLSNLFSVYKSRHLLSVETIEYLSADQLRGFDSKRGFSFNYQTLDINLIPNATIDFDFSIANQPFFVNNDWEKTATAFAVGGSLNYDFPRNFGLGVGITRKTAGYFPEHTIHAGTIWKLSIRYPYF